MTCPCGKPLPDPAPLAIWQGETPWVPFCSIRCLVEWARLRCHWCLGPNGEGGEFAGEAYGPETGYCRQCVKQRQHLEHYGRLGMPLPFTELSDRAPKAVVAPGVAPHVPQPVPQLDPPLARELIAQARLTTSPPTDEALVVTCETYTEARLGVDLLAKRNVLAWVHFKGRSAWQIRVDVPSQVERATAILKELV